MFNLSFFIKGKYKYSNLTVICPCGESTIPSSSNSKFKAQYSSPRNSLQDEACCLSQFDGSPGVTICSLGVEPHCKNGSSREGGFGTLYSKPGPDLNSHLTLEICPGSDKSNILHLERMQVRKSKKSER